MCEVKDYHRKNFFHQQMDMKVIVPDSPRGTSIFQWRYTLFMQCIIEVVVDHFLVSGLNYLLCKRDKDFSKHH